MPIKLGELNAALQYLKNKLPQMGMFSTLDELIRNSPQEQMPAAQWQQYLKPGTVATRAGVNFPLKAEELQYSGLGRWDPKTGLSLYPELGSSDSVHRDVLLDTLHKNRAGFGLTLGMHEGRPIPEDLSSVQNPPTVQDPRYSEYAHEAGVPGTYEESITTSPDFGTFPSHFSPHDLSWSRTTRHYISPEDALRARTEGALFPTEQTGPTARLIEEIQSDRHEAAAEKILAHPEEYKAGPVEMTRRGYRTPEDERILANAGTTRGFSRIQNKPPDTPFKDPVDYAGLELRKQLLNSVNQGDSYLALTRGADQIKRYEQGMGEGRGEGMSYVYDKLYKSALEKLARQYGARVQDLPLGVSGGGGETRPQTLVDYGVERPLDLFRLVIGDREDYWERARSLLNDYEQLRGQTPLLDSTLDRAQRIYQRGSTQGLDHTGYNDWHNAINDLDRGWEMTLEVDPSIVKKGEVQKTFPAMEITPEVAERVRKAGVPLWALAGATAAGIGSRYNEAQANPVEDAAMQNANEGYASGGTVGANMPVSMDPIALVQAAKHRHYAYKPLAQSQHILGEDYTPSILQGRDITKNPAGAAALAAQGVKGANKPQAGQQPSPLNAVEPTANGQSLPGFADGGEVIGKVTNVLKKLLEKFGVNPDQAEQGAQAIATQTHTQPSPQERLRRAASQGDPNSGVDPYNTADQIAKQKEMDDLLSSALIPENTGAPESMLLQPGFLTAPQAKAEGGSTNDSSLKWLADKARGLGIPSYADDRARITTDIAKQFYGLDEKGNPVLGGRAWLSSQKGTPPRILDELAALPADLAPLVGMLAKYTNPAHAGAGINTQGPAWSREAQDRLAALDKRVQETTGVGDARTLPEHIEDAAGMLATPLPAAKVAKEAPMLQRMLEYLTPVRPPTASRYATDSAALGGFSAALDKLMQRVSKTPLKEDHTVDPEIEDAAINSTNAGAQ